MSWVSVIDENEATDGLKEIYEEIRKKRGKISNIMKVHSLNPDAMKKHMDLYLTLMFGRSGLSREEREMIAVVVSKTNYCDYCINHHAEALGFYWKDDKKLQRFLDDFRSVELNNRQRSMLEYVFKLTKTPNELNKTDVDILRDSGFSDEDILNINLICSYFNFVKRIVLGLGVEFSEKEITGYKY